MIYSGVYSTGCVEAHRSVDGTRINYLFKDTRCPEINRKSDLCRTETTDDCQLKCEQVKYYDSSSSGYWSEFARSTLMVSRKTALFRPSCHSFIYKWGKNRKLSINSYTASIFKGFILFELNPFFVLSTLYCFNDKECDNYNFYNNLKLLAKAETLFRAISINSSCSSSFWTESINSVDQ